MQTYVCSVFKVEMRESNSRVGMPVVAEDLMAPGVADGVHVGSCRNLVRPPVAFSFDDPIVLRDAEIVLSPVVSVAPVDGVPRFNIST